MRGAVLLAASALLGAACDTTTPTASASPQPAPTVRVTASFDQQETPSAGACGPHQVDVFAVPLTDAGADLVVSLANGEACLIRIEPATELVDRNFVVVARSRPASRPPEFYPVSGDILHFDLSWSAVCPVPDFAPPLLARIRFSDPGEPTVVPLPVGFKPNCVFSSADVQVAPAFDYGGGEGSEGGIGG